MARTRGSFQPGTSGNPKGRPPKERALTAILETAGSASIEVGDARTSRKRLLAQLLWRYAAEGRVTLPDGRELLPSPREWLDAVQWLYGHIDGPAKQTHQVEGPGGEPLTIRVEYADPDA